MMDIPETYVTLVSRLVNLTRQNKLSWEQSGRSTSRFKATIGNSGVMLSFDEDPFSPSLNLSILNDAAVEIDSFEVLGNEAGFTTMMGLWDIARRQALRVDETIAGLERRLEELGGSEGEKSSK